MIYWFLIWFFLWKKICLFFLSHLQFWIFQNFFYWISPVWKNTHYKHIYLIIKMIKYLKWCQIWLFDNEWHLKKNRITFQFNRKKIFEICLSFEAKKNSQFIIRLLVLNDEIENNDDNVQQVCMKQLIKLTHRHFDFNHHHLFIYEWMNEKNWSNEECSWFDHWTGKCFSLI